MYSLLYRTITLSDTDGNFCRLKLL